MPDEKALVISLDEVVADRVRRGHASKDQHRKRESRFFVVEIERRFELRSDWYRRGEVCDLVLEYYVLLRSLFRTRAPLRQCLRRCRHCRIFFLSDPRNRGRGDLGCPFGCRDAHRRRRSTERSTAYNRSPAGKLKKKLRNGKRAGRRPARPAQEAPQPLEEAPGGRSGRIEAGAAVVEYLRVVVGLIEGRRLSGEEVLRMLRRVMRQRRFALKRRIDYVLRSLKEEPP